MIKYFNEEFLIYNEQDLKNVLRSFQLQLKLFIYNVMFS